MSSIDAVILVGGLGSVVLMLAFTLIDYWADVEARRQDEERRRLDRIMKANHVAPRAAGLHSRKVS